MHERPVPLAERLADLRRVPDSGLGDLLGRHGPTERVARWRRHHALRAWRLLGFAHFRQTGSLQAGAKGRRERRDETDASLDAVMMRRIQRWWDSSMSAWSIFTHGLTVVVASSYATLFVAQPHAAERLGPAYAGVTLILSLLNLHGERRARR